VCPNELQGYEYLDGSPSYNVQDYSGDYPTAMEGPGANDLEVVKIQDVNEDSFDLKVTKTNLMNGNEGVVEVFNDNDSEGCNIDVKDKDIGPSNKRKAYMRQWVQNYRHH
jgi:hypothetical protein